MVVICGENFDIFSFEIYDEMCCCVLNMIVIMVFDCGYVLFLDELELLNVIIVWLV